MLDYYSATLKEVLKEKGIKKILMIGYYLNEINPDDFTYLAIEVDDDEHENIFEFFYSAINLIEKSNIIYVHWQAGISLSASFSIIYVMFHFKYKFRWALNMCKKKGNYLPKRWIYNAAKRFRKGTWILQLWFRIYLGK